MNRILNPIIHLLSGLLLFSGILHQLRVRNIRHFTLRSVKSLSEALSPFLTVVSGFNVIIAAVLRAPLAVLASLAGGLLSLRYVIKVIRTPAHFEECFGENWSELLDSRVTPPQHSAMLKRRWQWKITQNDKKPRWERDLVYHTIQPAPGQTDNMLRYDLWRPPPETPPTGIVIIYIHGGGYFTSSKDFGTRPFFRHLSSQGHIIMDIDYRLGPGADLFDMLADVQHAVAWIKLNAEWLGGDPDRIVLAGGSAGAHLAMLVAYAQHHPRITPIELQETNLSVAGVVSYYGIVDLAATYRSIEVLFKHTPPQSGLAENLLDRPLTRQAIALAAYVRGVEVTVMRKYLRENQNLMFTGLHESLDRLLGGSPEEIPEVYKLISPLTYAGSDCPPTLFLQGEHDYLLPLEPARLLHKKLQQAGAQSLYVELPQTEHTFDLFLPVYSPPAQVALYYTERFLCLLGK